jgi:hypothetical protein
MSASLSLIRFVFTPARSVVNIVHGIDMQMLYESTKTLCGAEVAVVYFCRSCLDLMLLH